MSRGRNTARRREGGRKHLRTEHVCRCGRKIRGNAYYYHRAVCKIANQGHRLRAAVGVKNGKK